MHDASKRQLQLLREQAMLGPTRRRSRIFLNGLAELHFDWHTTRRTYGFLLFHADVIGHFKAAGGPGRFDGVTPFTLDELSSFGAPYEVTTIASQDDPESLRGFSRELETWHNHAHMSVEMALGVDMMNPRTNIYVLEFWRLHYFIQARFAAELRRFRPGVQQPTAIARVEDAHHSFVPKI